MVLLVCVDVPQHNDWLPLPYDQVRKGLCQRCSADGRDNRNQLGEAGFDAA